MITLNNVHVEKNDVQVLRGVDLHVCRGESVVLTGPSGSGKTSIVRAIVGALPVSSGEVVVDGVELKPENLVLIRDKVAFIGQEPVMGAENVRDALMLPFTFARHRDSVPDDQTVLSLLNSVNLKKDILDKKTVDISGGQKQRIAIVRALLLKKTIIFADELTSALDPESRQLVVDLLLTGEYTVVSISHDDRWINECDRIVRVVDGAVQGERL